MGVAYIEMLIWVNTYCNVLKTPWKMLISKMFALMLDHQGILGVNWDYNNAALFLLRCYLVKE